MRRRLPMILSEKSVLYSLRLRQSIGKLIEYFCSGLRVTTGSHQTADSLLGNSYVIRIITQIS